MNDKWQNSIAGLQQRRETLAVGGGTICLIYGNDEAGIQVDPFLHVAVILMLCVIPWTEHVA